MGIINPMSMLINNIKSPQYKEKTNDFMIVTTKFLENIKNNNNILDLDLEIKKFVEYIENKEKINNIKEFFIVKNDKNN
jgi:phage anti-repressor protein